MKNNSRLSVYSLALLAMVAFYGCEKEVKTAKMETYDQSTNRDFFDVGINVKSGAKREREYEQRLESEVERQVGAELKGEQEKLKQERTDLLYEKDQLNLQKLEKEAIPIPDEARKFYQKGIETFRKGNYYSAATNFKRIIAKYPNSSIAQLSLLKLGEIFFNQGNYLDSRFYTELLVDKYPGSIVAPEAKYLLGKSYFYLGNYGKTLLHLKNLEQKLKEKENKAGSLYYYSVALIHEGDGVTGLTNLHDIYTEYDISREMREKIENDVSEAVIKNMSLDELKLLQYRFPLGFVDAAIKGALITHYHDVLPPEQLNSLVLRYLLDYPSGRDAVMVKVVRTQLDEGKEIQIVSRMDDQRTFRLKDEYVQKEELNKTETEKVIAGKDIETLQKKFAENEIIKIGCVLPLSGRYAEFAAKVQQGIQLAESSSKNIKVVCKDSGDDEKNLFQVTRELVEDEKVSAIIGPLLSKNAYTIARLAETPFIPILTPTASDKGLVEKSEVLFSNALTGGEEGEYMAEYAIGKTGKGRYLTFKASDSYSMAAEEAFRKAIEKRGGSVIDAVTVKAKQTDYTKQIVNAGGIHKDDIAKALEEEKILHMKATEAGKEHVTGKNDLTVSGSSGYVMTEVKISPEEQKIINYFDGVYIAAHDIQAASVASQLRFMNINVQLLGNSKWRGKDFFKASGTYAKGSYITDDFYNNSGNYRALQFQKDFHSFFGEAPDKYAASGYAAYTILSTAYQRAMMEKTGLITALRRVRDYETITGDISFDEGGNIRKRLLLLEVKSDSFKEAR